LLANYYDCNWVYIVNDICVGRYEYQCAQTSINNDDMPNNPFDPTLGGGVSGGSSDSVPECEGLLNGTAFIDECGRCISTTTGISSCKQWFDDKIDDEDLSDCMKKILNSLKGLNGNSFSDIIYTLDGSSPGYNWRVKSGELKEHTNGQTSSIYDKQLKTATTTFDDSKLKEASDLVIARTIYHEAIHAYLIIQFNLDIASFKDDYPRIIEDWAVKSNWNYVHNEEFGRSLVNKIGTALKNYGIEKGYSHSDQFYNDLAWGGLESTSSFKKLSSIDKNRIKEVIHIEQTGKDSNGDTKSQKGKKGGC